ncbi:hypothetical protein AB0D38_21875, partial [Streptomyces sp. NPDC048279]
VDLGAESMLARRPEAVALAREAGLGDRLRPPATATAMIWTRGALRPMPKGHVMGVPGTAAAVLAMEHGLIPPTPGVHDICHDLDLVTGSARAAAPRTALVLSRGLMGSNSALVLRHGAAG